MTTQMEKNCTFRTLNCHRRSVILLNIFNYYRSFASAACRGNLAAVYAGTPPSGSEMRQKLAADSGAPATVFKVASGLDCYRIYCHSPNSEIQFCGHGALAAAHHLLAQAPVGKQLGLELNRLAIAVGKTANDVYELTVPLPVPFGSGRDFILKLFPDALESYYGDEIDVLILPDEESVRAFVVPPAYVERGGTYLAVTAADANSRSIYSRYFPLASAVAEDSATGSLHCLLVPMWKSRLGLDSFDCFQLSAAGGYMYARADGESVVLRGQCNDSGPSDR